MVNSDLSGVVFRYNRCFSVIRGHEFFIDGVIVFPGVPESEVFFIRKDGSYHTHFGPCVAHNGLVYGNCNHNVKEAFSRLTKCREPELIGFETWMQQNQRAYIAANPDVEEALATIVRYALDDYTGMIEECLEHYDDPHLKKGERIQAVSDMVAQNLFEKDLWYLDKCGTDYKFKKFEIGKPGNKPGRMIGSLGCPASLQGFRLTNFLKYALADTDLEYLGGTMHFCPAPSSIALQDIFQNLIDPPGRFYFAYFSDDSCMSIRTKDGRLLRCNLDISSCDASHTGALFDLMIRTTPDSARDDMRRLVAQCKTPIKIKDLANRKNMVILQPDEPRLYSGSTLTTYTNNTASILIASSVAQAEINSYEDIVLAARRVGYIVTIDACDDAHKLQFLKHSPVYDTTGTLRALLNPGVLFRLMGTCKGDLPGKSTEPFENRANRFQAGLLQGAYPRVHSPLIDALKASVAAHKPCVRTLQVIASELAQKVDATGDVFTVTPAEMWARYDLTPMEIGEIECDLARCKFGDHYQSGATDKVLKKDYGLSGKGFPDYIPSTAW